MVFLTAPMDLQQSPACERALELLKERHGQSVVGEDRSLFDSHKQWRKTYKEVYGKADLIYILAREDGTVGLGIYKQCRFADEKEIPQLLMFADGEGNLAGTGGSLEHEDFGLERLQTGEGEEQDLARFAAVRL